MLSLVVGSLALSAGPAEHRRKLSYAAIVGYSPGSQVTDHANVDLDQAAMETELGIPNYATAKAIYTTGAHSKPTAECVISSPATGLAAAVAAKAAVTFTSIGGLSRTGKAYQSYVAGDGIASPVAPATETKFMFTYPVSEDQVEPTAGQCYVGGLLGSSQAPSEQGCIAGSSVVGPTTSQFTIAGDATTYTAACTNRGKRTLQGFSTGAQSKMYSCSGNNVNDPTKGYPNGCPYTSFSPYYDYYGTADYGDKIVLAALDGTAVTTFTNNNVDFSAADASTRKEFTKKGTAYMHTWMYTIREYEDAIDDCTSGDLTANAGSSGPVHAWDEGVAFFVGSLINTDDVTSATWAALDTKGKGPYTLGNKRCKNFKTCGLDGTDLQGEAKANSDIITLAKQGQYKLLIGDCAAVVPIKNALVQKMTIPLVQGTLRYAYKVGALSDVSTKSKAEGAIFAAAVLPQVHACNPTHATTIQTNLAISSGTPNFPAVKAAFEACYPAMGITCAEVGGLWNGGATPAGYYNDGTNDASPCTDASPPPPPAAPAQIIKEAAGSGATIGIIIAAAAAALAILCVLVMYTKEKAGKPLFTTLGDSKAAASSNAA